MTFYGLTLDTSGLKYRGGYTLEYESYCMIFGFGLRYIRVSRSNFEMRFLGSTVIFNPI